MVPRRPVIRPDGGPAGGRPGSRRLAIRRGAGRMAGYLALWLGLVTAALLADREPAWAQFTGLRGSPSAGSANDQNQPVTFRADSVSYDRERALVTATGHVEAWQNGRYLKADKVSFDRNTNVAAATGHVVIVEPDGQTLFADYAELTRGMRDGVLKGMRALLAENGRMAANGGRRTEAKLNELSRGVYTTCNVCALDPDKPPLWQLRAYRMTQDLENKRIEYQDAYLDFLGFPVLYTPYFSHSDPSVKRQSGFLVPDIGLTDKHLGQFVSLPYYWVLNDQSDLTLIPLVSDKTGPQLTAEYRERFNEGTLKITGAAAYDEGAPQGYLYAHGAFDWDSTWRYGFDVDVASSSDYLRDFRIAGYGNDTLASDAFLEGFGQGSYARLDTFAYQALNTTVSQNSLPYVLPRYSYSFAGEPDALGGRLGLDAQAYNIYRVTGTKDQRAALSLNWDRPFTGLLGERYTVTLHDDSTAWNAHDLDLLPSFGSATSSSTARSQPTAAVRIEWPFVRSTSGGGSQLIEPIVQLVAAPNQGNSINDHLPNEDAFAYEFNDATLFSLNRYDGLDRLDGGMRVNAALHANWSWGGQQIDGLVGQSYRAHVDQNQLPLSGLEQHASDVVSRIAYTPNQYLDLTGRANFNWHNGNVDFADGVMGAGLPIFHVSAGYLYSNTTPYYLTEQNYNQALPASYFQPRNEASVNLSSTKGPYTVSGYARRDLATGQMVAVGAEGKYENECFIFDVNFFRRYTSINGDNGDTTLLFTLTFKTVGQFGFNGG